MTTQHITRLISTHLRVVGESENYVSMLSGVDQLAEAIIQQHKEEVESAISYALNNYDNISGDGLTTVAQRVVGLIRYKLGL